MPGTAPPMAMEASVNHPRFLLRTEPARGAARDLDFS